MTSFSRHSSTSLQNYSRIHVGISAGDDALLLCMTVLPWELQQALTDTIPAFQTSTVRF